MQNKTSINVAAELKAPGRVIAHELSFELKGLFAMGRELFTCSPITVSSSCVYDGETVLVSGSFTVLFAEQCARCGAEFTMPLSCSFSENYRKVANGDTTSVNDDDAYTFFGDVIDIEKLIYDTVLLEYPLSSICGSECVSQFEASEESVTDEQEEPTSLGAAFARAYEAKSDDNNE